MLIIPVKDGGIHRQSFKKYKRKFDKTGTVRQLRARQQFIKPSVTLRQARLKAAHKQRNLARKSRLKIFLKYINSLLKFLYLKSEFLFLYPMMLDKF
jgi:small subunit ribosomal protein S21